MEEVGKLLFLLAGTISSSLISSFGSLDVVSALIYLCWVLSTPQSCTLFACSFLQEWVGLLSYKNISRPGMSMEHVEFRGCYNQPAICKHSWLWIKTMPSLRRPKVK